MRPQTHLDSPRERRRGAVLLIVITLMALFTAIGLSFVYYAEAEATASKLFRESTDLSRPDAEPELALAFFLGKFIYGERDDDQAGIYNPARGHDLARSMYGYNYDIRTLNGIPTVVMLSPQRAYTGTGRLHYLYPTPAAGGNPILSTRDEFELPSYQYFPLDGFLRDPERVYLDAKGQPTFRANPTISPTTGKFAGGFNAPYTYPDLTNFYLAAVRADGTVLTQSFHRKYLFGEELDDADDVDDLWYTDIGKYLTLRARPIDQLTQAQVSAYNATVPPAAQIPWPIAWRTMSDPQKKSVMTLIGNLQQQNALMRYPENSGGDVRNLPWGKGYLGLGGNDSIWIDFGAPVMVSEDGRKYKMLFAPLIIDLDGRVNLNVHGNIKNNGTYAGNQGWGRWEVDLNKVLNPNNNPQIAAEVKQLFGGRINPNVVGRYGTTNGTATGPHLPAGQTILNPPVGMWYSPVDFDGINSGPLKLPVAPTMANPIISAFPTFPAGYNNSSAGELTNHPAGFNYYNPFSPDRTFPITNMEALLRYTEKGSPAFSPELFRLLPQTLSQPTLQTRIRNMVSTDTFDLNRPSLMPWVWDDPTDPKTVPYKLNNPGVAGAFPTGPAIPFPALKNAGAANPRSEFRPNWSAIPAALSRLDLNRPLPDYPAADPNTGLITDAAGFAAAQKARQDFARDIYNLLLQVTGTPDFNQGGDFFAQQWLAQLAVNIVDYIDNDDYITPFDWRNKNDPINQPFVYGTELPRLLINEAYVQFDNNAKDSGLTMTPPVAKDGYNMNIWFELHNPFQSTPAGSLWPRDTGNAILQTANNLIYRLDVCETTGAFAQLQTEPVNVTGDPDYPGGKTGKTSLASITDWSTTVPDPTKPDQTAKVLPQLVQPANGAYADTTKKNVGFYVAGPPLAFPYLTNPTNRNPNLPVSSVSPSLSIARLVTDKAINPALVLRRLACPHLPPNDPVSRYNPNGVDYDKTKPLNPYITVDYMENLPVNDGRIYNDQGQVQVLPPLPTAWNSVGRRQPYAANPNLTVAQNPYPPPPDQPKNTFFRHNAVENTAPPTIPPTTVPPGQVKVQTLQIPFDWLVHLDRPLISPLELLHVSGYRPHLLTHQFITGTLANPVKFTHYANWFENTARLYRFFEYAGTRDYMLGANFPARVPGKVNINTIWEPEVFRALCGGHPQADALFTQMRNVIRTPAQPNLSPTVLHKGSGTLDRPFLSLATGYTPAPSGQYPSGIGINNTILRPVNIGGTAANNRLFQVSLDAAGKPATHPYQKYEVLTKLFNNVTTRSNVFAVWVTVGFFEVIDDSVRPVKLGAEIGRSENRHLRHRFFAILDRSDLRRLDIGITPQTGLVLAAGTEQVSTVNPPLAVAGQPKLTMMTRGGTAFVVDQGDELVLEPNTPNEEVVLITAVVGPTAGGAWQFKFTPTRTHTMVNATTPIPAAFRGNPGPWVNYNPRLDTSVVRYFSVID
jgi:hypothetical protein